MVDEGEELSGPLPDPGEPDGEHVSSHPGRRRLVALVVALFLLAMTLMAAGYSLFRAPPHPDRTRPIPPLLPHQGAVR